MVFYKTADTFNSGQKTMPAKYYTDPSVFAKEKEIIFENGWVCVGHSSRIPKSGDYFLVDIFQESLIVVRGKKGDVKAYYNVCRHRGTRVCDTAEGHFGATIQCPYHAWTYSVENGKLIGAPFMKNVEGFNFEDNALTSVNIKEWEGFLFVSISDDPPSFEELFAPMMGKFSKWNLNKLSSYKRIPYKVKSNWKYVFQNFNECYHCPTIHPLLNKYTDFQSGKNDMTDGPFLGGYLDLTEDSMTVSGSICADILGDLGEDIKHGYYYTVLPNLLINIHPDYVMFHLVMPVDAFNSVVVSEWLFAESSFGKDNFNPEDAVNFWHETNLQDWKACEWAQQGVVSKSYQPGWYTPRESLLAAFDRHYLNIVHSRDRKTTSR